MHTFNKKNKGWKNHKFRLTVYYFISINTFFYFFACSLVPFIMIRISQSWLLSLFYIINWLIPIILAACWADNKLNILYVKLLGPDHG